MRAYGAGGRACVCEQQCGVRGGEGEGKGRVPAASASASASGSGSGFQQQTQYGT